MQRQRQVQRQTLKYSPQQIQILNLLHLTTTDLAQRIKEEIEQNPLLEEASGELSNETEKEEEYLEMGETVGVGDDEPPAVQDYYDWDEFRDDDIPDYRMQTQQMAADEEPYTRPLENLVSFREELKEQVHFLALNEQQRLIADFILDSLNDDGFLDRDADVLADDMTFTSGVVVEAEEIEAVLRLIQQMEPPGIAARTLRECLLIQLDRTSAKPSESYKLARRLVSDFFDELGARQYDKIMRVLDTTEEAIREALLHIVSLNPKPASALRNDSLINESIKPDFLIRLLSDTEMEVKLAWGNSPALRLNAEMEQLARQKTDRATRQFLKTKLGAAKWFIEALKQRETTLLATMRAIVKVQFEFFLTGDIKKLKPMILKDIADLIEMDISTVSRVTTNKHAQTPFGIIHLKDLFTEGVAIEDGSEVSNRVIQQHILEMVAGEDKRSPLSDQQLTDSLADLGYHVARRTVAKYRDQLGIASAKLRVVL